MFVHYIHTQLEEFLRIIHECIYLCIHVIPLPSTWSVSCSYTHTHTHTHTFHVCDSLCIGGLCIARVTATRLWIFFSSWSRRAILRNCTIVSALDLVDSSFRISLTTQKLVYRIREKEGREEGREGGGEWVTCVCIQKYDVHNW